MEKTKNKDLFESMPIAKAVMKMAIPTIIGQLIVLIYNMADTFFIGRTNNPDMVAGASLILPVFNITLSVACLSGVGGSSLVSRLLGESKEKEARKVYSFCVYFSLLMGAIFSLAVFFFMEPLLCLLGADADTFEFAKSYTMCVIVFGGIPTIISNILSNFVRSIGESGKAGLGITLGGILNIILDPIFMFYILPRGNEILGAGIATFISNCISCLYYVIVIKSFGKGCLLHLLPIYDLPAKQSILKIAEIGVPASISTLLFDLDYIIIDKLMSGYGNTSLAAMGIVLKAERLPLNIGIGICQGMVPIIAYNYSFGNYK